MLLISFCRKQRKGRCCSKKGGGRRRQKLAAVAPEAEKAEIWEKAYDAAQKLSEEAKAKAEAAQKLSEEAKAKADTAEKRAEDAEAKLAAVVTEAEKVEKAFDAAQKLAEEAKAKADAAEKRAGDAEAKLEASEAEDKEWHSCHDHPGIGDIHFTEVLVSCSGGPFPVFGYDIRDDSDALDMLYMSAPNSPADMCKCKVKA